jgi:hypothetical protein
MSDEFAPVHLDLGIVRLSYEHMMQHEYVDKLLYLFGTVCLLRICPIMSDVDLGRGIG